MAPPAPSMLGSTPALVTGHSGTKLSLQHLASVVNMTMAEHQNTQLEQQQRLEPGPSGTISSLRNIRARKLAQATTELDNCRQRVGTSLSSLVRSTNTDNTGEGLANEERGGLNRMQAEYKALLIEVENLKNERKMMLSRLEELEKPNSLRKDMNTISNQVSPLKQVPEELAELTGLPASVVELRDMMNAMDSTVKKLDKWRLNQSESLTLEKIQKLVTESVATALQKAETNFATKLEQVSKNNSLSASVKDDVSMLVKFKKQTEDANWSKQLRVLKDHIGTVRKDEQSTFDNAKKLRTDLEDLKTDFAQFKTSQIKTYGEQIKQFEKTLDDKIKQEFTGLRTEIRTGIGPLKAEQERTGKTMLARVQGLETSNTNIQAILNESSKKMSDRVGQLETAFKEIPNLRARLEESTSDLTKAKSDFDARLKNLSATDAKTDTTKELHARLDLLDARFGELRGATSERAWTGKVSNLEARISDIEPQLSLLTGEMQTASANITSLNDDLFEQTESVHKLSTFTGSLQTTVGALLESKLQHFKQEVQSELQMQLRNARSEAQFQVTTPQPAFSDTERQQIQETMSDIKTLQTASKNWQTTMQDRTNRIGQSIAEFAEQIEIVQTALQSLEKRYENISTDALHQQMVHWFIQSYPNAHDLLHQFKAMQQEVLSNKNKSSWMFQCKDDLLQLAQSAGSLALVVRNLHQSHGLN
jgi:chromosome segregation ATPase